jgi:prolyl-tRNA editing enzyme YbaK/EbsC (Cys-tRNA(Pro) deacylase)
MPSVTLPGTLDWKPALDVPELLGRPVLATLRDWPGAVDVYAAAIDADLADTTEFCAHYGVAMAQSANCVVVSGRREGEVRTAACIVLATTRTDVNGTVRRRLDVRKASFLATDEAVVQSGMEYGGITPVGLPESWPVLVDAAVLDAGPVVIGSGIRSSKLTLPAARLTDLPRAEVVDGLAR